MNLTGICKEIRSIELRLGTQNRFGIYNKRNKILRVSEGFNTLCLVSRVIIAS